ncbi:MAG TPA: hypothetical protein VNJ04_09475 [Gemmatimonadaceae bacterium]|nr:hypothetical protein [Gemmatimonadaceae bacterium]
MSLRIIKTLARFENVDDLPADTITAVLVNSALRQRMGAVQDKDKEQEFVKEAIVEEVSAAKTELEEERKAAKELQGALDRTREEKETVEAAAKRTDAARQGEVAQLQAQVHLERDRVAALTRKLEQLEQWTQTEECRRIASVNAAAAARSRVWFVVAMSVSLAVSLGSAWLFSRGWSTAAQHGWKTDLALALAATAAWMTILLQSGKRWPFVADWSLFAHTRNAIFWTASTVWGLAVSIFGSWLWEVLNV